jgi:hypothetical protein
MSITTPDEIAAAMAARGTPVHWIAMTAGVSRHVLEAWVDGDLTAMTTDDLSRVARAIGVGERVLEVPVESATSETSAGAGVLEAPAASVSGEQEWRRAARAAGVDVDRAFGPSVTGRKSAGRRAGESLTDYGQRLKREHARQQAAIDQADARDRRVLEARRRRAV